jgi:hypothetical protein
MPRTRCPRLRDFWADRQKPCAGPEVTSRISVKRLQRPARFPEFFAEMESRDAFLVWWIMTSRILVTQHNRLKEKTCTGEKL